MNITCHACARTWEIEDDGTSAQCAFCGREHDAAMIATSRAAAALGKLGGRSTSPAKLEAVRKNGKRGGRPQKGAIMYKIVDTFNGWESDRHYKSTETAERDLEKMRRQGVGNRAVVSAAAEWRYDHNAGEYLWAE